MVGAVSSPETVDGGNAGMSTTSLFVELVVIGAQGIVWIGLLVLSATGWPSATVLKDLNTPLVWVGALLLCYTLGVVLDRAFDYLGFRNWEYAIRDTALRDILGEEVTEANRQEKYTLLRLYTLSAVGAEGELFTYYRHRVRIARATAWNFALIAISVWVYCIVTGHWCPWFVIPALLFLSGLAVFCWWRLVKSWHRIACRNYKARRRGEQKAAS